MNRRYRLVPQIVAIALSGLAFAAGNAAAYFPSVLPIPQNSGQIFVHYDLPSGEQTVTDGAPFTTPSEQAALEAKARKIIRKLADGFKGEIVVVRDPSLAYNVEFTNTTSEPGYFNWSVEHFITPLQENTIWGELTLELEDTSGDGEAYLNGNFGDEGFVQGVSLSSSQDGTGEFLGSPVGANMVGAGTQTISIDPFAGPTPPNGDMINLSTSFIMSPGDTVQIKSQFIIDEGTGISFAEIPTLEDLPALRFYNVINSPDEFIGDQAAIGSNTQLNVFPGGSVGDFFSAGIDAVTNDEVEVNISGGSVGDQFRANGGSVVNISGGAVGASFQAGHFSGNSEVVKVNISGGTVGNNLQAYPGSVVNISAGNVGRLSAPGGVINISGGTVEAFSTNTIETVGGVINISGGEFGPNLANKGVSILTGGVVNISGGAFTADNRVVIARDGSELHLFGTEFLLDGVAIDGLVYGESMEISDRDVALSGLLTDGSMFGIDLNSEDPFPATDDWIQPGALITVTLVLRGDYNMDGIVGAADYTVWRDNLDTDAVLPGDTTPGMVTAEDYSVWKANFGTSSFGGGSRSLTTVPEPTNVLPLAIASILVGCCTRSSAGRARRLTTQPPI